MFQGTFEQIIAAAGFSNVENMLRLQKCLKGMELKIMRDKLLLLWHRKVEKAQLSDVT